MEPTIGNHRQIPVFRRTIIGWRRRCRSFETAAREHMRRSDSERNEKIGYRRGKPIHGLAPKIGIAGSALPFGIFSARPFLPPLRRHFCIPPMSHSFRKNTVSVDMGLFRERIQTICIERCAGGKIMILPVKRFPQRPPYRRCQTARLGHADSPQILRLKSQIASTHPDTIAMDEKFPDRLIVTGKQIGRAHV